MGWSFRKSKSFGPLRLNFSKSGIGASFGIKGARISVNSKGTYVNLGAHGIYYRQKISGNNLANHITPPPYESPGVDQPSTTTGLHTITSGNVANITDSDSHEFVKDLQAKSNMMSWFKWLGVIPSIAILLWFLIFINATVSTDQQTKQFFTIVGRSVNVRHTPHPDGSIVEKVVLGEKFDVVNPDSLGWVKIRAHNSTGFVRADLGALSTEALAEIQHSRLESQPFYKYAFFILFVALLGWCVFMYRKDQQRMSLEIFYTMDNDLQELHQQFLSRFNDFASCKKIWQNLHVQTGADRKYNAGASQLVNRTSIRGISANRMPTHFLKTNVNIPYIALRNTELYFFPERIIAKRGNIFGASFYKNIQINRHDVNFVEENGIPSDAKVIEYTWKYLNKSGGPDRRFNNNRQIPVCRYSEYHFESDGGLREVITTSREGGMDSFAQFIAVISKFQRTLSHPA